MTHPNATREDIEDGVEIDFVARVMQFTTFEEDGNTLAKIEDQEGNLLDFKIWEGDADPEILEEGKWFLFESAEGDIYGDDILISSNRGKADVLPVDPPDRDGEKPSMANTGDSEQKSSVLAFDIETITTVPEEDFDFQNSGHVELLSIGVGFAPNGEDAIETQVLLRSGTTAADEVALLEQFCEYVERRDPDELLIYKGVDFDKRHLLGRAELAGDDRSVHERVESVFETYDLRNIDLLGSLEDNADVEPTYWDIYNHNLNPVTWRESHPNWDDDKPVDASHVENTDIPLFGERYLKLADGVDESDAESVECRALRELIVHYTRSDIQPLFGL